MLLYAPTAPLILPTAAFTVTMRMRLRWRLTSNAQMPSFMPKVMGSAWMPCVRPTSTVSRNSNARRLSTSPSATRSRSRSRPACLIWSARAVSSMSLLVMP